MDDISNLLEMFIQAEYPSNISGDHDTYPDLFNEIINGVSESDRPIDDDGDEESDKAEYLLEMLIKAASPSNISGDHDVFPGSFNENINGVSEPVRPIDDDGDEESGKEEYLLEEYIQADDPSDISGGHDVSPGLHNENINGVSEPVRPIDDDGDEESGKEEYLLEEYIQTDDPSDISGDHDVFPGSHNENINGVSEPDRPIDDDGDEESGKEEYLLEMLIQVASPSNISGGHDVFPGSHNENINGVSEPDRPIDDDGDEESGKEEYLLEEYIQTDDPLDISGGHDVFPVSHKEIINGVIEPERSVDDDDGDKKLDKESDKENEKNLNRSANAKELQFKLIGEFIKECEGAYIEVKQFNKRWEELVSNLNSLGPPPFTQAKWRLIWAQHQYNKELVARKAEEAKNKQSHGVFSSETLEEIALTTRETAKGIAEISDKRTVTIKKEDAILQALQQGNNLLKEIAQSLNKRPF